jgi:precorrin-6A synthase
MGPEGMKKLFLIGIGTGNPDHLTGEARRAIAQANVFLIPRKRQGKEDLAALREQIIREIKPDARIQPFDMPERDDTLPYLERVNLWHDDIARRWTDAVGAEEAVAMLVWGDPSLYDSTLRIAERLDPKPDVKVIAGITAIQALTAAHAIPLNTLNAPVTISTGRRLRDAGWPEGCESLVVMLDGTCAFQTLAQEDFAIWWGAFLGMPEQILISGPLAEVSARIVEARQVARERHGWIMDTYLLRCN